MDDGADIIDCSVQMSKDGVAFCMNSADLIGDTTVMNAFMSRATTVLEIQKKNGIFSFDLTWSEIHGLKRNTPRQLCTLYFFFYSFLLLQIIRYKQWFSEGDLIVYEWLVNQIK